MQKKITHITEKNVYKKYIVKTKEKIFTYSFKEKKSKKWGNFDPMKNYALEEKFLNDLFNKYKSNKNREEVFIKVRVLDSFYSTNLKEGLNDMVDNIIKIKNFDKLLKDGNIKLIDKMKNVKSTRYNKKECISFASKYCSRYQKEKFAIYDKYVKEMLYLINKATGFTGKQLKVSDVHKMNYKEFCSIVDCFIKKFNENKPKKEKLNYKSFDRYIWTWAKEILYKINKSKQ